MFTPGDYGLDLFGPPGQAPQSLWGPPHTHTCPADAVEIVTRLAFAAETPRGVHTVVARAAGLGGWRALVHIWRKRGHMEKPSVCGVPEAVGKEAAN